MRERPILFSAPMVRALLAGTKTQTRRALMPNGKYRLDLVCPDDGGPSRCPYGQAGDRLWVRETHFAFGRWETRFSAKKARDEWHFIDMTLECGHQYAYPADGHTIAPHRRTGGVSPTWWKRPAIFMRRAACRLVREVVNVRVERLQDISEADAIAEGVEDVTAMVAPCDREFRFWRRYRDGGFNTYTDNAIASYASLWTQINGPGSWEANPWVWVVEFKPLEK